MRQTPHGSILGLHARDFGLFSSGLDPEAHRLTDPAACTLPPMQITFTPRRGHGFHDHLRLLLLLFALGTEGLAAHMKGYRFP